VAPGFEELANRRTAELPSRLRGRRLPPSEPYGITSRGPARTRDQIHTRVDPTGGVAQRRDPAETRRAADQPSPLRDSGDPVGQAGRGGRGTLSGWRHKEAGHECSHDQGVTGSRRPFRSPDEALEPEDEEVPVRRAERIYIIDLQKTLKRFEEARTSCRISPPAVRRCCSSDQEAGGGYHPGRGGPLRCPFVNRAGWRDADHFQTITRSISVSSSSRT